MVKYAFYCVLGQSSPFPGYETSLRVRYC